MERLVGSRTHRRRGKTLALRPLPRRLSGCRRSTNVWDDTATGASTRATRCMSFRRHQGRPALHPDDHRPRRPRPRPDLRLWHDGLRRRAVGPALDHDRHPRVPLALARQRLLTATFPCYELKDPGRGPAGGFVYKRKQNRKGEEVGGIVPHVTLKSIANDEPPAEEVLVDRPEVDVEDHPRHRAVRRRGDDPDAGRLRRRRRRGLGRSATDASATSTACSRCCAGTRSLQLGGDTDDRRSRTSGRRRSRCRCRPRRRSTPDDAPVAIVFGPENGAVSEKLVYEAAREAHLRSYAQLLVIGFAIEPNARALIEKIEAQVGIPATYVQATPDLVMGDLLKTMRSSQIFTVCGLPDVAIRKVAAGGEGRAAALRGRAARPGLVRPDDDRGDHRGGDDVPAGCSTPTTTASPSTSPRRSSRARAPGTTSGRRSRRSTTSRLGPPRRARPARRSGRRATREVAVKVIDDRGNELLVVKSLDEAEHDRMSCVRGRAADPQLAVRGAGRALAHRGGHGTDSGCAGRRQAGYFYRDPEGAAAGGRSAGAGRVAGARARQPDPRAARGVARGRLSGRDADDARAAPLLAPRGA